VTDDKARVEALRTQGWRQGSVLPLSLVEKAKLDARWPERISVGPDDWVIVLSHDCDLRNGNPDNEPYAEVLVARRLGQETTKSGEKHGRNSRRLQFRGTLDGSAVELFAHAHERFPIERLLLAEAPPDGKRSIERLDVLITWITKRYQRQAFPDEFDILARKAKDKVDKFLSKNADQIAGVFIAFADIPNKSPRFNVAFRIVIKTSSEEVKHWPDQQAKIEEAFESCWEGVPDVEIEVTAVQDRHFSIRDLSRGRFRKFDRDWISYATDPDGEAAPDP
jgi:hypothetical protein